MKNQHGGQTTWVVATWANCKPNSIHTVAFYVVKSSNWLFEEAFKHSKDAFALHGLSVSRTKAVKRLNRRPATPRRFGVRLGRTSAW